MTLLCTTRKFLSLVFPTSSSNVCVVFAVSSQDASSLDNLDLAINYDQHKIDDHIAEKFKEW